MYVILVYDIHMDLDGPKVWRKVFKTTKRYLNHVQNSVFEGELTASELFGLRQELKKYVRDDVDSVIAYRAPHQDIIDREFWGIEDDKTDVFL